MLHKTPVAFAITTALTFFCLGACAEEGATSRNVRDSNKKSEKDKTTISPSEDDSDTITKTQKNQGDNTNDDISPDGTNDSTDDGDSQTEGEGDDGQIDNNEVPPTAEFGVILPSSGNITSVLLPIVAEGAATYRYKVLTNNSNCGPISSYSAATVIGDPLTVSPSQTNGDVTKVCIIAVSATGVAQTTPTTMSWTHDSSQVTLTASYVPSGSTSQTNILAKIDNVTTARQYKVSSTNTCANSTGYTDLTSSLDISGLPHGNIYLCLIGTTAGGTQTASRATIYRWKKTAALVASSGAAAGTLQVKTIKRELCGPSVSLKIERIVGGNIVKTETKSCSNQAGATITFDEMCHTGGNSCLRATFTNAQHTETSSPTPSSCLFSHQTNDNALRLDVDTNGAGFLGTCKPGEDDILIFACPTSKRLSITDCQ